jgi:multiple sugar transport system permease protein
VKKSAFARIAGRLGLWAILVLFLLWTLVPIYVVVSNSLKTDMDIFARPFKVLFRPTLANYQRALTVGDFGPYFRNSLVVALSSSLISVALGVFAAYGFASFHLKGLRVFNWVLVLGKSVPTITILLPFFVIMARIRLLGSYAGPILTHTAINLPFVIWLIIGFINDIPSALEEAALIDGASKLQSFWYVLLPILAPAIGSAVILSMQLSWNELLFSLQLTNMDTYTLPVGIAKFVGAISVDWGKSSAAATVTMLPIIIVGFFIQKYLVRGMTMGAVKG